MDETINIIQDLNPIVQVERGDVTMVSKSSVAEVLGGVLTWSLAGAILILAYRFTL
jgi:hypothetical protein